MTWLECQRYIKVLMREQLLIDKFVLRAYRALEQAMA